MVRPNKGTLEVGKSDFASADVFEDAADLIGSIIQAEPEVARITRFKTA